MYKENRSFHTPNEELTIWRYIDFTKFVDLLISKQLFFCRSDKFEDPFEGVFRLKDYEEWKEALEDQQLTKKFYFLNCWHINNIQSDAMWKIFLQTNNGIAIKSTVGSLIKSLECSKEEINIGEVYYRDLSKITFHELMNEEQNQVPGSSGRWSTVNQFNYKRKSFEHERELRVYYIDMPIPHTYIRGIPREILAYKRIDISLADLINEIVVAPFADDWFIDLIKQVVEKFDLDFKVTKSDLYYLPN